MCSNAEKTVFEVLGGIITTTSSLVAEFNLQNDPDVQKILAGLAQAQTDVQNWKPGTAAQTAIQILQDIGPFLTLLGSKIPAPAVVLIQTIAAGIAGVIGTLEGNGEVPAGTTASAHQLDTTAHTLQQVKQIAPNFHYKKGFLGMFQEAPVKQYNDFWNSQCDVAGYPQLKVA
jgi:hypothetical protein